MGGPRSQLTVRYRLKLFAALLLPTIRLVYADDPSCMDGGSRLPRRAHHPWGRSQSQLPATPGGTRRGVDRAKQSQFPLAGMRPGDRGSPLAPLVWRSIAPNKPNCPKRGTEAVSGSGKKEASALRVRSYGELYSLQAAAKQSQFLNCGLRIGSGPAARHRLAPPRPAVQTNPIWPVGPDLGGQNVQNKPNSCHYADREIGVPGRAKCAKRTQFTRERYA